MQITLNDVKDFFKQIGYTWKGELFINNNFNIAQSFRDFNTNEPQSIILYPHNSTAKHFMTVLITSSNFEFYNSYYNFGDIDDPCLNVSLNHSNTWQQYLFNKYGKEYQQYLIDYAKTSKKRIIKNLVDEINDLKLKRHTASLNAKAKIEEYNQLERNAKLLEEQFNQ